MRSSPKSRDAQIGAAAFAVALILACALTLSGILPGFEGTVKDTRDRMRLAPATGEIVLVEIDGHSLQTIDEWPWPRGHYADAVAELDRLGAAQIAFDIDFSARSSPEEDAKLAKAFARLSEPAILPTFRQFSTVDGKEQITEALPIPEFRENTFIASVNVSPSADGRINEYLHGVTTDGIPRPSLANMLAKTGGEVDSLFQVDQAIDINTIPRVSFLDLIEGRVSREEVSGKRIVIGATAIELFDRYPTALFGVQPGAVIQIQAAETLMQERDRTATTQWIMLLSAVALLAAFLLLRARSGKGGSKASIAAATLGAGFLALALAFDQRSWIYLAVSSPLAFLTIFIIARRVMIAMAALNSARLTDTASGIPNRAAMRAKLRSSKPATVGVARLADFSEVTTMLGSEHMAEIDQAIARRLGLLTGVNDVYRLDSGVFAWLLPSDHIDDLDHAFSAARALFNSPFEIAGERLRLVAHFGSGDGSVEDAEEASKLALKRGLGWATNAASLIEESQFRQRLLGELDEALANGAISVVFQPKLRISDQVIASGECLVRWNSPQMGRISPADFIPILEEKGRISDLTLFVLQEALARRDLARAQGNWLNLAVNVSAQLLSDEEFIAACVDTLEMANARAQGGVTLEITESAPLVDSVSARDALKRLTEAGARISIDDYGTGQASLNYLQDFPATEIKLDQSFVRNLAADRKDQIMVQSTIDLAHALGFDIVAEGIEDAQTLSILAELGCDYGQGWEIGKPVAWSEFAQMLGQWDQRKKAA